MAFVVGHIEDEVVPQPDQQIQPHDDGVPKTGHDAQEGKVHLHNGIAGGPQGSVDGIPAEPIDDLKVHVIVVGLDDFDVSFSPIFGATGKFLVFDEKQVVVLDQKGHEDRSQVQTHHQLKFCDRLQVQSILLGNHQPQQLLVLHQSLEKGQPLQEGQQIELGKLESKPQNYLQRNQLHKAQPQQIHPFVAGQVVPTQNVYPDGQHSPPQQHHRTQRKVLYHQQPQDHHVASPRNQFVVEDCEKISETLEKGLVGLKESLLGLSCIDGRVVGEVLETDGCVDEERNQVEVVQLGSVGK